MPEFVTASDGVALAFERLSPPEGPVHPAIVLVHGFGSSRAQNWKATGWYGGLTAAGFPIVAMDCRGHGDSGKPHDPAAYGHDRMAEDVALVMKACSLSSASTVAPRSGLGLPNMETLRATRRSASTSLCRDWSWPNSALHPSPVRS